MQFMNFTGIQDYRKGNPTATNSKKSHKSNYRSNRSRSPSHNYPTKRKRYSNQSVLKSETPNTDVQMNDQDNSQDIASKSMAILSSNITQNHPQSDLNGN